jgi:thioesterase superfamily protein 4
MADAISDRLASIPWVSALLNDPKWTRTRTTSRVPKSSGEDSFFAETLATDRTIRACLTLRPTEMAEGDLPYREIITIVDLGDGLNGYPQICHGGMIATLLDEVCGVLIVELNKERSLHLAKESVPGEAILNASYMTACTFICKWPIELQD